MKNPSGKELTYRECVKRCKKAGIKTHERLMLHCLRKSRACIPAENGIGNKTLLELGGWGDIRVLDEFYSKASDENKKKAVEVLDRLMRELGAKNRKAVHLELPSSDINNLSAYPEPKGSVLL